MTGSWQSNIQFGGALHYFLQFILVYKCCTSKKIYTLLDSIQQCRSQGAVSHLCERNCNITHGVVDLVFCGLTQAILS